MIKILVVDDHTIVREGLKQIFSEAPQMKVTGEVSNGKDALRRLSSKQEWDVVVLDISLPDMSGLEVLKYIRKHHPQLPVLILTIHGEERYAMRVLKAGAAGYLTKESAPEQLIAAVEKIAQGGKFITPTLAEKLVYDLAMNVNSPPHTTLSDREYQVLCLIGTGKSTKQIAEQLELSVKTVSTYRSRILQKMGMRNSAELVYYVVQNQLIG